MFPISACANGRMILIKDQSSVGIKQMSSAAESVSIPPAKSGLFPYILDADCNPGLPGGERMPALARPSRVSMSLNALTNSVGLEGTSGSILSRSRGPVAAILADIMLTTGMPDSRWGFGSGLNGIMRFPWHRLSEQISCAREEDQGRDPGRWRRGLRCGSRTCVADRRRPLRDWVLRERPSANLVDSIEAQRHHRRALAEVVDPARSRRSIVRCGASLARFLETFAISNETVGRD